MPKPKTPNLPTPRLTWPMGGTCQVLNPNHGRRGQRGAIHTAVLAHLAGGGTIAGALAVAKAHRSTNPAEDLRLLAAAGNIALPDGCAGVATIAQRKAAARAAV